MVDYWFGTGDERLQGTICVPVGSPVEAAEEIHRWADHPQVAGVIVATNPFHKALGHPVYHPIYAAAAAHDLPVITHLGSDVDSNGALTAGGLPTTKTEYYAISGQPAMHHLTSILVEGVFEKYPTLRFLFNEYGFAWVPWLLWGLDARTDLLRHESPYLRRKPSEYFQDHVWMGTQPFVSEARPSRLNGMLDVFGGMEDKLCYASDFAHWDAEWPQDVTERLPEHWRPKVLGENAARLFGWSVESLADEASGRQVAPRV